MNWLCLVIGVVLGAAGQRLLGKRQRQRSLGDVNESHASSSLEEQGASGEPGGDAWASSDGAEAVMLEQEEENSAPVVQEETSLVWLAYVRALERAQFQGGFLARTAHELRSPLSSLMGLQQLILTDLCDSPEEERQCVAQSYEASQNLHRLMDQLIRVAKLEQGSQRLDIQSMDLDMLLEDVESFVHLQVADRNCRFHLSQSAQTFYGKGDYNSLRQVLVMLVEAALAQQASEIRLGLDSGDREIKVQLWSDKPWAPMAELREQLEKGPLLSWSEDRLAQLKQSLSQEPGASFVPYRLSPGMTLLVSQLILALNNGSLRLDEGFSPSVGEADDSAAATPSPEAALGGESEGDTHQEGYSLELCLPAA